MPYYFAYGSNMDRARLADRLGIDLQQSELPFEVAILDGYDIAFNKLKNDGTGAANIVPSAGTDVEGLLYRIEERHLSVLDKCEGVPHDYRRQLMDVRTRDGRLIQAHVYIAAPGRVRTGLRPSREYMQHLLSAEKFLDKNHFSRIVIASRA